MNLFAKKHGIPNTENNHIKELKKESSPTYYKI